MRVAPPLPFEPEHAFHSLLLPDAAESPTYIQGEVQHQIKLHPIRLKPLLPGRVMHLFSSPNNFGAAALVKELQAVPLEFLHFWASLVA